MQDWPGWLWVAVPFGIALAVFVLDRLGLWLEDRGLLYYRRKKPSSSPLGAFVALQQFIEPGSRHVQEVGQNKRVESQEALRERLIAQLLHLFDSTPVNIEAIRQVLAAAARAGLDWRQLYAEATQVQLAVCPEHAERIPALEHVTPFSSETSDAAP